MKERLKILNYQPTQGEKGRLEDEGVSLQQILKYDQPSKEDYEKLAHLGYGLVDMILLTDVRKNLSDAVAQCIPLTQIRPTQEEILEARQQLVRISKLRCQGNPYPGRSFTMDKAREFVATVEHQQWTFQNLKENLTKLSDFLEQTTV